MCVIHYTHASSMIFYATRSRDFSATRPPLAASETARRVQAVYDGTSPLLVRRRTILPGGPDHAVGCCNCQTWSQICCIQYSAVPRSRRSETGPLWRLAHVHGTNFHHRFVASIPLLLSNVNLRHFLYNHAFN